MRVSNVGGQNWRQIEIRKGKIEGFADLVKKEVLGYHSNFGYFNFGHPLPDTEEVRKMKEMGIIPGYMDESKVKELESLGHIIHIKNTPSQKKNDWETFVEYPLPYIPYPMHIAEFASPLKFNPGKLTDEKKAELNKKYRLDRIKPESEEYYALIKDLQEKGLLSPGRIYKLPPSVTEITTHEKGDIRSIRQKFPAENSKDAENFIIFTRSLLAFGAKNYEALAGKENRTREEQAVVSIYESHQNIMAAIEEVFSEQLA